MLKKSLLLFILILGLCFSNVLFAEEIGPLTREDAATENLIDAQNNLNDAQDTVDLYQQAIQDQQLFDVNDTVEESTENIDFDIGGDSETVEALQDSLGVANNNLDQSNSNLKVASKELQDAHNAACKDGDKEGNCIEKSNFIINVNDISPGMKVDKDRTTKQNVNFALGTIIQKLMIALGSLSLLIMTVGAGYIVLHSGQDELLSKGKSIFMSGIYALVVALGSYYLIAIFRYILYT